jgi:ABC-2 type transport system permease protein
MLGVCVIIFPEMSSQMGDISDMLANMGAFSDAFGVDQLNFGNFIDYFAIECGNTLGLGGSIFAAILGISALSKEEGDRTAEFLLSHPISRSKVVTCKLLSILAQLLIFNTVITAVTLIFTCIIGESSVIGKILLLFLSNLLMQLEIAMICLGISSFLRRSGLGIGIGIAFGFYFLNILSNLSDKIEYLKFITPFGYTDGAAIIKNGTLEIKYLTVGLALTGIGIAMAYKKYISKDIA